MNKRRKKLLKESIEVMFKGDIEEIIEKKTSSFGSGSHVILPSKHKGKKVKIIIYRGK